MGKPPTTGQRDRPARAREKRRTGPLPVGAVLESARETALRRSGAGVDRQVWRDVVGDRIAKRTAPGGLSDGVLTIVVSSPVWAQELSFLSDEITSKLRQRSVPVASIRFRTGSVSEPGAARRVPPEARPLPIPDELRARLERIEDPELRAAIEAAAGPSLANAERAERARATPKPAARAPRSAAPRSARSGSADSKRSAGPRRSSEDD